MGGFGSGRRRNREDERRKPIVEDALTLDAAKIELKDLLRQTAGTLRWMRDKREIAAMFFMVRRYDHGEALVLRYTSKNRWDHWPEEVEEEIPIEETTPNFGGRRRWFSCPGCDNRVRTLHIPKDRRRFRCRDCHGLTYRSVRRHDKRVDELVRSPERVCQILDMYKNAHPLAYNTKFFLAMKAAARMT